LKSFIQARRLFCRIIEKKIRENGPLDRPAASLSGWQTRRRQPQNG